MFDQNISSLNRQQSNFLEVSQQIASGRRVVNPSDDPQAASRAVRVDQSKAVSQQFADSRVSARNSLAQTESILNSVSDAVTRGKTLMVQASNGTLSDADRQSVASELRGVYESVIGQANATDGNGSHLFGGYKDSSEPFIRDSDGKIEYVGDENARQQRIDSSRLMNVAENGKTIFQSAPSGAGYIAEADSNNTGTVTFSGPQVVDSGEAASGEGFKIVLSNSGAPSQSNPPTIEDASGNDVTASATLTDQQDGSLRVKYEGVAVTLDGEADTSDTITVAPTSADETNTDLFKTFEKALDVLENPANTDAKEAALDNTLKTVMREFDNSLDNVLTERASVGARLNELDVVDSVGSDRMINYESTLSDLVDLDYAEAVSEFSLRQAGLQASQKTFAEMKDMSLFNFL